MADNDKAAFGIYPGMGKRSHNDRTAAKEMPLQAARGWAAGTLGLPGDLEGLARALLHAGASPGSWFDKNVSQEPALPTSDFYKEWLPGHSGTPQAAAAGNIGSLFGGVGAGRLAGAGVDVSKMLGNHAIEKAAQAIENQGPLARVFGPQISYVVKPKGGNWMPLGGEDVGTTPKQMVGEFHIAGHHPAIRNWRDKQLTNYVKNQMGAPGDPLVALEKEGRLPFNPEDVIDDLNLVPPNEFHFHANSNPVKDNWFREMLQKHKELGGGDTMSPLEVLQAHMVTSHPVGHARADLLDSLGVHMNHSEHEMMFAGNEERPKSIGELAQRAPEFSQRTGLDKASWMDKLAETNPDSVVYSLDHQAVHDDAMNLNHVRDYLQEALNADTALKWHKNLDTMREKAADAMHGAPLGRFADMVARNLHLSPEQLERSSVADIFGKTADWDKMLAEQRRLEGMNQGIRKVHKTYDDGHQWVELSPEGLANEGNAMRHCVGGYCQAVEDGSAKILSLRDPKGEPKVTVELRPSPWHGLRPLNPNDPEEAKMMGPIQGYDPMTHIVPNTGELFNAEEAKEAFARHEKSPVGSDISMNIQQIKGPANRKPSDTAIPFVQDLLKGGIEDFPMENWGHVGDLHNTNLLSNIPGSITAKGKTRIRWTDPANPDTDQMIEATMPQDRFYTTSDLRQHFTNQGVPDDVAARHAGDVDWLLKNIGN